MILHAISIINRFLGLEYCENFADLLLTCDPTVCVVVLPHCHELHGGQPPQLQRGGVPELAQVVGGQGQLHTAAAGHPLQCEHRTGIL